MSLTFYYSPMSTAVVTHLVLEELGVPYEKITLDLKNGETRKPDFLRMNPNGKVPLVVHDGTPIWESAAITLYLGEVFGVEKGIYPAAGPKRGEAMRWIVWMSVTFGEAVHRLMRNTADFIPAEQRNAKAAEVARGDLQNCLRILDQALEGRAFLLGAYTLADTHANAFIDWLRFMKIDLAAYAHLNAWSQRCSARPAYARAMAAG